MPFTDRITNHDLPKMSEEYQDLLRRVLTVQADCEIGGPKVYAERWMLHAPTADDMWRVARIVAEEIDHFRKFAHLLKDMDVDAAYLVRRVPSERALAAFREKDPPTWGDVAAFCALVDRVGRFQVEEFTNSSYQPLDPVLEPIFREEIGHISFGVRKLQQLAETPDGNVEAQAAVERWLPKALDMFGHSDSKRAERYLYWGLKHRTNGEARDQYFGEVSTMLTSIGLEVPDPEAHRQFM